MTTKTDIEITGTCNLCGHRLVIDVEMSNAPDVPEDEIFVECEMWNHGDCTEGFVKISEVQ